MTTPIAYGIDFGTTNSSIAAALPHGVELVPVEFNSAAEILRSVVYLGRNGNQLAGESAVQRFLVDGARRTLCGSCSLVVRSIAGARSDCHFYRAGGYCQDARLLGGLKSFLSDQFPGTHSWAHDYTMEGLVGVVLRHLKQTADNKYGADVKRAVIGYPVAFVGTEGVNFEALQDRAEKRLVDAGHAAGFSEIELYPEPAAAASAEEIADGIVLAVDFGGGTFDAAVIEYTRDGAAPLALRGVPIGGDLLDEELFHAKCAKELGLAAGFDSKDGRKFLPNFLIDGMRSLTRATQLIGDTRVLPTIQAFRGYPGGERLESILKLLYGGFAYEFYKSIEDAKIALSEGQSARIRFNRPGLSLRVDVTRAEFEDLIEAHIKSVAVVVLDTLDAAGVDPGDIDLVVRTGGSSRIPLFVRFLENTFGAEKVLERHAFTTVARGLAIRAHERWAS